MAAGMFFEFGIKDFIDILLVLSFCTMSTN